MHTRIAALSNIHGSLAALDTVLEDVQTQGTDLIINLGDVTSGPLRPRETVDQLMASSPPTIRGNHKRQVLAGGPSRMGASDQYVFEQLRPDQLAWFANLLVLRYINDDILLVHRLVQDDQTYFLESLSENGCHTATHDEVLYRAEDTDAKLVLHGHTHMPHAMKLTDGCFVVSPGSVGLQVYSDAYPFAHAIETGSSHARYAVVTKHAGEWTAEFRTVEYAWNDATAIVEQRGRQDWAVTLRTGRVQV